MIGEQIAVDMNTRLEERMAIGRALAESKKWAPVTEGIEDPWVKGVLGWLLEHQDRHFSSLSETTKAVLIGDFEKFAFPLVRAIFP